MIDYCACGARLPDGHGPQMKYCVVCKARAKSKARAKWRKSHKGRAWWHEYNRSRMGKAAQARYRQTRGCKLTRAAWHARRALAQRSAAC